jgi:peptidyl-prolyl cis-trans isomerase D
MLNIMRKNAGSWIIKVVFCIIVVVFIFWGVGSFQDSKDQRVALVNDEAISLQSYQTAYDNALQTLQQQYGNNLNKDTLKMLQLPQRIIQSLVTKTLMLQEAEKLDIRVSDKELAAAIQSMTAFQESGIFNAQRYRSLLSQNKLSAEQFEASQRENLIMEKLQNVINSGLKVTDGEILEWYNWKNASVDINYVMFDKDAISGLNPSDEELQSYYNGNKENYKTEEKVKVRYLAFGPEQFASGVTISDDEIKEYYDAHPSEFNQEKTVEARHILLKMDEKAEDAVVQKTKEKAEEILKMAREGQDFAELAKQYSEDPGSKEDGGYLGAFKKEAMIEPFAEKAFSMKAGEISDLVQTQYGFHIIKVEKVSEASVTSLADAAPGIREKLTKEAAKGLAYDKAETVFDEMLKEEDVEKTAETLNMTFQSTDFFTSKGPESGFTNPAQLAKAAFALENSEISNVLEIGDQYYILQKSDVMPAAIPELSEVKEKVRSDLIAKMQDEQAAKKADEFLKALQGSETMEKLAADGGLSVLSTGYFTRSESIPEIGRVTEINEAAFLLTDTKKLADKAYKCSKGYCVIQFKSRKLPDAAELEKEKESLKAQILSQKQEALYSDWLKKVSAASEISIEKGYQE